MFSMISYRSPAFSAGLVAAFTLVWTGCTQAQPGPPASQAESSGAVAFVGVNVVPMDEERVVEGRTVIVQDGRITAIGPTASTQVPAGAVQIAAEGKFLMPGLAEMHGHIPTDDRQYAEDVLVMYVANGVTLVRGMLGAQSHLDLREQVAAGDLIGPTIFAAGPSFGGNNAGSPEAAENLVREHHAAGYDFLKVMNMQQPAYEAMVRTANELGIDFAGHVPGSVGIVGALEAGQRSVDHLDQYVEFLVPEGTSRQGRGFGFFGSNVVDIADPARIPEIVEATVAAGVWNVPTLSLVENMAMPESPETMIQAPEMGYMPPEVREEWVRAKHGYQQRADFQPPATDRLVELRRQLTKALHDAGALIALGSDAPQWFNVPGFSLHREMGMMVAADLTPYEVLVTGTRNPAEYFGTPDEFGTVQVGRRADLILLNANPLLDIANAQQIDGVMVRGEWLPQAELQSRLDEIAARNVGN